MPDHPIRGAGVAVAVWTVVVLAVLTSVLAAPAAADDTVVHQPPVDAPVVDPFRPPATRFGPGNRGLTYDLAPGTAVRASADGTVVFAGQVAGTLHVTVLHADGLRTSYSFLGSIAVHRGQTVGRGDTVGTGGVGFHFGLRDGDTYLDPASLFDGSVVHVRLVPHREPGPPTDDGLQHEHAILRDLVLTEDPGVLRRIWNAVAHGAEPVLDGVVGLGSIAVHLYHELPPADVVADIVEALWRNYTQACTKASVTAEAPATARVALLVAGLGSNSESGAIDDVDTDTLGYAPADVLRFSYRGGRVPGDGSLADDLAAIPATSYTAEDTNGDIVERGRALADLLQQVAATRPGVPIDLYAHSLGGLVTRVALLELAHRPGGLAALGSVVTIATPHDGADLATGAAAASPHVHQILDVGFDLAGMGIDADGTAVRQLAETSDFIDYLHDAGVPDGVAFRTIGGRGDIVVTADHSDVAGQPSAVVDVTGVTAHDRLPGDPAVTRELQLALAGLAPACDGFVDAVLDAVMPQTISWGLDSVSLGLLLAQF